MNYRKKIGNDWYLLKLNNKGSLEWIQIKLG